MDKRENNEITSSLRDNEEHIFENDKISDLNNDSIEVDNKLKKFIKNHKYIFILMVIGSIVLIAGIIVICVLFIKKDKSTNTYELIDRYIDKLIKYSTPEKPLWNIELITKGKKPSWNYIDGCMMGSLIELYKQTGEERYIDFVINYTDYFVKDNGTIYTYNYTKFATDDIAESRILFDLYNLTGNEKYKKAIENTYKQILEQPRTYEGSFWHKKIYPNQVWLDGLYMAQVFYMRYETEFNDMKNYSDIRNQFEIVHNHMKDENKSLYYHGYDATKSIFWANNETGLSQSFWLRAMGWYVMSLIDICEYMNKTITDDYNFYANLFKETLNGLLNYQDKNSKMFWQVIDQGGRKGNYLETSGSFMVAYALLKGTRLGILPSTYQKLGVDVFNGICKKYLSEKNGDLNLGGICLSAGLGPENNRTRNGTYEYYISEPVVENDAKGVGPLIVAYTELKKIISK